MVFYIIQSQGISDYITAIIGVLGTLIGTFLGWLLHYISENREKLYITVDDYQEQRSNSDEYGYIAKIFIYNASYKQQCIRDMKVLFVKKRNKSIVESIPSVGECSFITIKTQSKKEKADNVIFVNSNNGIKITLSDLLDETDYQKISEARKIYLLYKNRKNRSKKKLIKAKFIFDNVQSCGTESFL